MKYSELKKLLKKAGCRIEQEGARHEIWYSPKTGSRFPVGRHNTQDVKNGTLKSILKAAGIE
ncbi:MAG: type II toxin-antitoxin system HicA family toxin [Clostridia bacterium]|nr:type II toxin-antitoxin system HicA family toxin [Clostridia bacterium]